MQNVLEIIIWYKNNFRELPWRQTKDPYKIWLSEIILQQTQVNQGLKYYERFVEQFPDIQSLANSDELLVLKLWQGLGYYSRARNLLKTAKLVTDQYHGIFPRNMEEILKLPGIGHYTASALLSFAYNLPFPTLDGNVFRVISRLYNIRLPINEQKNRSVFMQILEEMIQNQDPTTFNNAMMELGAIICKPEAPKCDICPVSSFCEAKKLNVINLLPVKSTKIKKKKRYFTFFYINYQDGFYLQKREANDIWQNLYQLPLVETDTAIDSGDFFQDPNQIGEQLMQKILKTVSCQLSHLKSVKHVLTHQDIYAQFFRVDLSEIPHFQDDSYIWVDANSRQNYPLPILIEKFLLSL